MKKCFIFLCSAVLFLSIIWSANAQLSKGGTPPGLNLKEAQLTNIDEIVLQGIDLTQTMWEDSLNGEPMRVGKSIPVSYNMFNSGTWTDLPDGTRIWRLKITSPGALALALCYDQFYIPEGGRLFLYNESKTQIIGAYDQDNNPANGVFSTEMVQGSTITLEYVEPKWNQSKSLNIPKINKQKKSNIYSKTPSYVTNSTIPLISISEVVHVYRNAPQLAQYDPSKAPSFGASGSCEVNVNCSEGSAWQNQKRGVAEIFLRIGASWYYCTGSLVNTTNNSGTPYFLTAEHCYDGASTADLTFWQFYFKYESATCANPGTSPAYSTITGCTFRAAGNITGGSDFTLLELNTTPGIALQPYYNGWDRTNTGSGSGVGIHHPAGDIKKISTYTAALGTGTWTGGIAGGHWTIASWAATTNGRGVTEGGSSGSPLFNSAGRVIGTLTGGASDCPGPYGTDYYGKFYMHWDQNGPLNSQRLKPWLDPLGTNPTTVNGYDPYATSPPATDFVAIDPNTLLYPIPILGGANVDYQDLSWGAPTSWSWTFPGGTPGTSSQQNPSNIVYNTAGLYDVTLMASNVNGDSTVTAYDYIHVYDPSIETCDTLYQFWGNPSVYTATNGYVSGSNGFGCQAIAEKFESYGPINKITGGRIWWAQATNGSSPNVTFVIWADDGFGGPGAQMATTTVPLATVVNDFNTNGYTDFTFPTEVIIPSTGFFLGFLIPGNMASGDTLAVITNDDADNDYQTGYSLYGGIWETYDAWGLSLQNTVFPFGCYDPFLAPVCEFSGTPTVLPATQSVAFTDLSYGGTPTTWSWVLAGGTPGTSTNQNPNITYNTPGYYDVTLTATNANGSCSLTKTNYIKVNSASSCICTMLDHVQGNEDLYYTADGYVTGNNEYDDAAKAEYFDDYGVYNRINGVYFSFGHVYVNNPATNITINVWNSNGTGGAPGTILGSSTVNIATIAADVANGDRTYIQFATPIAISAPFYVGFMIPNPAGAGDTLAVLTSVQNVGTDDGWELWNTGVWYPYSYGWGDTYNNAIYPVMCTVGAPLPDFSASTDTIHQGGTVTFNDLSTCSPTAWSWVFSGGTPGTSVVQNPSIVYNTVGTYNVQLTSSNVSGNNVELKPNYITVTPLIVKWDFPNNPDDANSDGGILLNYNPPTYKTISVQGGVTAPTFTTAGASTRCASAVGWASGTNTKYWQIEFATTGYQNLKVSSKQTGNNNRSPRDFKLQYKIGAGGAWTDIAGTTIRCALNSWTTSTANLNNVALPTICNNQPSVYLRWLVTSTTGINGTQTVQAGWASYIDDIIVSGVAMIADPPVANFSGTPTTICAGNSVAYSDLSTNSPTSWAWTFPGGTPSTSTLQNPVITYSTAGNYNASLIATNTFGSDTITYTNYITVNPSLPVSVNIAITAGSNPSCSGSSVTFTATPTNGGTTPSYQWQVNGVNVGTNSPTYISSTLTTGNVVTCILTSNASCATGNPATSNAINMTVNPTNAVSVSVTAAPGSTVCQGVPVTFTANPINGGSTPTYQWFLNGSVVGGSGNTYNNGGLVSGDAVYCILTSNVSCPTGNPATSNTVTMTVNPNLPVSVSITASANPICSGASVTFTATPVNGGGTPTYQWKRNGSNVGANSPTYITAALANGDIITCQMNSSLTCTTGNPATSNSMVMSVNPNLPVSVSIAASATTICSGTSVTFTATPVNGGTTPAYQWKVNGINVGANSPTYISSALANGDQVTCQLTSNISCPTGNPATSNTVVMTVNPLLPVSVSVAASANPVCEGTSVTFTATPTNGGTTPSYQWYLNGSTVGSNSAVYTNASLATSDQVYVVLTSNATCPTGNPATSNTVTMTVNPSLPVSVSITASVNPICAGTSVTFTATPTNGGAAPTYQWKVNGINVGANSPAYTTSTLANGNIVTCVLTSNATCAINNPATSNAINMTVNPNLPVSVSIAASANPVCAGTNVTFTATPVNGGGSPTYQWYLNGLAVGSNSATYSNNTLVTGDQVYVRLTSNATCPTGNPATSNTVTMTVNPNLPVSVNISASANPVCAGTSVTFTATPVNGGAAPVYQWYLNGLTVGSNSATYSNSSLTTGDQVYVVLTSNATCPTGNPATSNTVTMTVNPNLPVSVSIAASANPVCAGTNVTFTATPVNGGGSPTYQWYLNGSAVGSNSATYSNSSLSTGDQVYAVLTSNATCPTGSPATSNTVTMTVNPNLAVSVSIAASANPVCAGTSVTFTATPLNGGGAPSYQWYLNGSTVGSNSATYSNSSLASGDQVYVVLTSNATCATGSPATSNTVTMTVNPNLPVSISIAASANPICSGTSVTFTATPTNGGAGPVYQWKRNGIDVGINSPIYSNAGLVSGDIITCVLTSNATCASGSPATSNAINITVNPNLPVSVSIAAVPAGTICPGTSVTYTASPTNGGTTPAYQWYLNGLAVGSNSSTYTNTALANGDQVNVVLTSNATCPTGNPATSNTITATLNASPVVTVNPTDQTIGDGGSTSFTVSATGTGLTYQWQVSTDGGTIYNNIVAAGTDPVYGAWNTATLTLSNIISGNDGYMYQCIVSGTCSPSASSTAATLTVNNAPAITSQPFNVTVCDAAITSFGVTATGTITGYTWQLSTDGGTVYNDITVAGSNPTYSGWDTPALTLLGVVAANDGYLYRCIVYGPVPPDAYSNPALLTVIEAPAITAQPADASICEGAATSFSVTAINQINTYQWQLSTDGGTIYNNIVAAGSSPTYSGWTTATLNLSGTVIGNNGYMYRCIVSGNCSPDATSDAATLTMNPNLPVNISVAASLNPICDGTNVTFTATPINPGSTPVYQWYLNGATVGSNSTTYTNASLANNDEVYCILTSNATCATGSPATSNTVTMTVNPNLPVSVSIAASATTICAGTSVTFTATPTNGGSTPVYQWYVNALAVGSNSTTYTSATLSNLDVVTCELTSDATCATGSPATSNVINMTVNPNLPVSVSIVASANPICTGSNVTFTATPTNGGTTPAYQWKRNGLNVGVNNPTYSSAALVDGDIITCELTSNATCATGSPATSNSITMSVNSNLPVSVSITPSTPSICAGSGFSVTANPVNGGSTPVYQWYLNGNPVGGNTPTLGVTWVIFNSYGNPITCVLTSSESCATGSPATSNAVNMTVNPNLPVSVSIAAVPAGAICDGTSVTFTATPTNGGTTPAYQWYVNGLTVGSNSNTFTSTTLSNLDIVTCELTSNVTCPTGNPATSNAINMTVNPNLPVSVSIIASSNPVCDGASVTFTATPVNEGGTPVYEWFVNGIAQGVNSNTFTTTTLTDGNAVHCELTSNATCATGSPATSDTVTMTVNPNLPVSVSIAAVPSGAICDGTSVTFTATPTNGGTTPAYQWYVNGLTVGSNSTTYTSATLSNLDVVTCEVTSNATCATGNPATSNAINMTVNPNLPVSVSIAASSNPICSGTSVTFTATPTNGGTTPAYQWYLNGLATGSNSATYTNAGLADEDSVSCILTSNAACAIGSPATSNGLVITVNPILAVSVSIAASPSGTICEGTGVTFTATPQNEGIAPTYTWKVNGITVGSNSATFNSSTLLNGDEVTCELNSSETCTSGNPASSNMITMAVDPVMPVSISISASPAGPVCDGTNVTFTASAVNSGTVPVYEWYVNGIAQGVNSTSFSSALLADGDSVNCQLTSDISCTSGNPAVSNGVIMTVNNNVTLSAGLSVSPSTTICAGTQVDFTALSTNAGSTPSYQWMLNGVIVGTDSNQYSSGTINDGDEVWCVVTGSETCALNSSTNTDTLAFTVSANLPVSVNITADPANVICEGTTVSFIASGINGGTTPIYQWYLNGNPAGGDSATYINSALSSQDTVYCVFTSSEICASSNPAASNLVGMTVNPIPVAEAGSDQNMCSNSFATLTASGGTSYEWSTMETSQSIDVYPSVTSVYYVTVTDNGCSSVDSVTVSVLTAPNVNLGPNVTGCAGTGITLDAGVGFSTYDWSNGASTQTIFIDSIQVGLGTWDYSVTVTAGNGCQDADTVTVTIESCAGIAEEADNNMTINLYPNPTHGLFNVVLTGNLKGELKMVLINVLGQYIYEEKVVKENGKFSKQIDLSAYPKGMYYLSIQSKDRSFVQKIILN